jgi:hypothetical protein
MIEYVVQFMQCFHNQLIYGHWTEIMRNARVQYIIHIIIIRARYKL